MKRCVTTELSDSEFKQIIFDAVAEILEQKLQKLNLSQQTASTGTNDKLLSRAEVCKLLRISLPTLSKLQKDGKLKFIILGGSYRYRKKDVEKILNSSN